jgi:prepilin signal peptidase PulO-like enzyme (type II secretory pathway)
MMLAALPLSAGMALAFVGGLIAGAYVNWAAYWLAWNRRHISPWSPPLGSGPPRRPVDRIPVLGWLGLSRESGLHGRGFWLRPLVIEMAMGAAWAALYWWEVGRQELIAGQFDALARGPAPAGALAAPTWITIATFASHALLLTLMAAASAIDIDEKTIPDEVTRPGTLLALLLATVAPMSLLPHVALRGAPAVGVVAPLPAGFAANDAQLVVEPVTLAAPNAWPAELNGAPEWLGLAIGLACFATWLFALAPRIWRGRRGPAFAMRVIVARVARELARPANLLTGVIGSLAIVGVWYRGGDSWVGLLTALVGIVGGSAMVWAVRIAGSLALQREALGFGDVTLMMMIGAFLGWQACVIIFFIAPFAALLVGILQMVLRRDNVIPYGPFLCLGAAVVTVRWADFWNDSPGSVQGLFFFPGLVPAILAVGVAMLFAMLWAWRIVKERVFGYAGDNDNLEGR